VECTVCIITNVSNAQYVDLFSLRLTCFGLILSPKHVRRRRNKSIYCVLCWLLYKLYIPHSNTVITSCYSAVAEYIITLGTSVYTHTHTHTHTHVYTSACACLCWSVTQRITSQGCEEWLQLVNKFRNINVSISDFKVNFPQYLVLRLSIAVKCTAFPILIWDIKDSNPAQRLSSSCLSSVPSHEYLDSISN
jgi:hypothetical protein